MRKIFLILQICITFSAFGQDGITFKIEKLEQPDNLLFNQAYNDIYERLILQDASIAPYDIKDNNIDFSYNILAKSQAPDSLVSFGYNSFFNGMYQAYADHRPFVISPDMIWLLVTQGFARHVNANSEELRHHFVDFSGKLTLVVESKEITLDNPDSPWENIFPQFTEQIGNYTGSELIEILTSDFSTTTPTERIASEITIMEAMEPYFEYVVMYIVCGIPEITLKGTPEDWQEILDKTKKLEKYNLKWWTKKLEPILEEFVQASKGNIDNAFWRNMFKYHSQKKYGAPNIIDGWIVKFFPYDIDGKRNNLKKLVGGGSLPEEIVKVDLKYVEVNGGHAIETELELWAGFIGLEQNPDNFALTPKIGWMIKKKDVNEQGIHQKLEMENIPSSGGWGSGIDIRIIEVPENLKNLSEIYSLNLHFKGQVFIPEWLRDIRIGKLEIEGKISKAETDKIIAWFPNTELKINSTEYNVGKNGWTLVKGNEIPAEVLKLDKIWILEIWSVEFDDDKLIIPETLGNIEIENFSLVNETSPENIEKIKRLLPNAKLFMRGKRIH